MIAAIEALKESDYNTALFLTPDGKFRGRWSGSIHHEDIVNLAGSSLYQVLLEGYIRIRAFSIRQSRTYVIQLAKLPNAEQWNALEDAVFRLPPGTSIYVGVQVSPLDERTLQEEDHDWHRIKDFITRQASHQSPATDQPGSQEGEIDVGGVIVLGAIALGATILYLATRPRYSPQV